jgi:hypothetical protein
VNGVMPRDKVCDYAPRHRGGRLSECSDGQTHVLALASCGPTGTCDYAPACGAAVEWFTLYFTTTKEWAQTEPHSATCAACVKIVDSGEFWSLRDRSVSRFS